MKGNKYASCECFSLIIFGAQQWRASHYPPEGRRQAVRVTTFIWCTTWKKLLGGWDYTVAQCKSLASLYFFLVLFFVWCFVWVFWVVVCFGFVCWLLFWFFWWCFFLFCVLPSSLHRQECRCPPLECLHVHTIAWQESLKNPCCLWESVVKF